MPIDRVIYWDASAVLSFLFQDNHTAEARRHVKEQKQLHLISTLTWTETIAVIYRLQRQDLLSDGLASQAIRTIKEGPWRRLNMVPRWDVVKKLSKKWPLRGADLWHLATAKTLQREFSELCMLTFDKRLIKAAKGEGLGGRRLGS